MTTHIQSWLWLEYFSKYVEYFMLKVAFYGLLETVQMFSVEMLQVTKTSFAPSIWGFCSKDNLCVKTIFEQIRSLKLIEEKMSSSRDNLVYIRPPYIMFVTKKLRNTKGCIFSWFLDHIKLKKIYVLHLFIYVLQHVLKR